MALETPEEFYARVAAVDGEDGRPRRILQFRGSPLLDWEENLPLVPAEVHRANAAHVGEQLVERFGGDGPSWATA